MARAGAESSGAGALRHFPFRGTERARSVQASASGEAEVQRVANPLARGWAGVRPGASRNPISSGRRLVATGDHEGHEDAGEERGGSRAARSWRVEGRAPSGKREGVQRINPLARVWAGVRPSGAGKESARSAQNFGQGQPPAGRLRCRTTDWRPGGCPLAKARIQKRVACIWVRRVAASAKTRPAPKPRARRAASRVWPLVVTLSTK